MSLYKFAAGFVALGTAACAAFFSVIGIATFLGGNFVEVAIMAGFLEAGKLICASAAYRFRKIASGWIRALLVVFTIVMMFITSTGIFGFLSSSYQKAASERSISEQKIENVRSKKQSLQKRVSRLERDRKQLTTTQDRLQKLQSEQGWLSRRQDERLSSVPSELSKVDSSLTATRDSVLSLNQKITELEANQGQEAKLGPIMFVANTVGLDPDQAALYFILLLIFVFDPMAVTLIVALSMATEGFEETVTEKKTENGNGKDDEDAASSGNETEEKPNQSASKNQETENEDSDEVKSFANKKINVEKAADLSSESQSAGENDVRKKEVSSLTPDLERLKKQNERSQNKSAEQSSEFEQSDDDGDYLEWLNEATSEETTPEEKPWKNPFKAPFGNSN